ncbi:MAG: hypothetical protein E6I53_09020 [Chloroflexi bacterium]|nr:MAG: hypothetical protein E6I71_04990 [Chloroflexota bacterium]TME51738.1 MAG: hypothetical protein E6I53_09020 [Chloroflexota bacterium]
MVKVEAEPDAGGWVCEVDVEHAGEHTQHTVTVSAAELARWGRGDQLGNVEDLVERSFEFLLLREPPSSILRRFELSTIQRYFPDYDREIR